MSRNDNAGRIPKIHFIIASMTLFTLAILFTFCRIIIRLRYQTGGLSLDDTFLAFGVACLCVSFALALNFLSSMFLVEAIHTGYPIPDTPLDIVDQLLRFHRLGYIFVVLTHTTMIYWWTVTLITGAVWGFGVVAVFIPCHNFDKPRYASCNQKSNDTKIIGWSVAVAVLDIITDILLIAIPIRLLWRVQIKLGQKLAMGAFLCLSVMMIITVIVRMAAINAPPYDFVDLTWEVFWQLSEACIAVMMCSLTTFRTFFLAHAPTIGKSPKKQPLYFSRRKILNPKQMWRGRAKADSEEMEGLPEIPRATLTGMRTFIGTAGVRI